MKKLWNIIKQVVFYLVIVVALFAVVFTLMSSRSSSEDKAATDDRKFLGFKAMIVLSDSMKATDFAAGDVIFIKNVDPEKLEEGDIITFIRMTDNAPITTITHKIRRIEYYEDGTLKGFVTYGTTTNSDDDILVEPGYIVGEYKFRIPKGGHIINFMRTPVAFIFFIAGPFLFMIIHEIIKVARVLSAEKKEQQRIAAEEREKQLEDERLKNEQMLREIEELKRKLAGESKDSN